MCSSRLGSIDRCSFDEGAFYPHLRDESIRGGENMEVLRMRTMLWVMFMKGVYTTLGRETVYVSLLITMVLSYMHYHYSLLPISLSLSLLSLCLQAWMR